MAYFTQFNSAKLDWAGLDSVALITEYFMRFILAFIAFYCFHHRLHIYLSNQFIRSTEHISYCQLPSRLERNDVQMIIEKKVVFDWTKRLGETRDNSGHTVEFIDCRDLRRDMEHACFDVLIRAYLESICSTYGCHVWFVLVFVQFQSRCISFLLTYCQFLL